jgi:hypothetical protein
MAMAAISRTVAAMAGAAVLSAFATAAQAMQPTQDRIGPAIDTPRIELELRAHEQRMLRAQEEHRLNLEIDRDAMRYRPPDMRVPRVERNCRLRLYGNNWIRSCG